MLFKIFDFSLILLGTFVILLIICYIIILLYKLN